MIILRVTPVTGTAGTMPSIRKVTFFGCMDGYSSVILDWMERMEKDCSTLDVVLAQRWAFFTGKVSRFTE